MYRLGVGTPSARSGKWNLPRNYMLFVDKICTHHRNFPGGDFRPLLNELNDEWEIKRMEMDPEQRGKLTSGGGLGSRMIPAYTAVKDNPELQPWESMKAILQMADKIATVDCPCRIRMRGNGNCQLPNITETCFLLNRDADYAVDSGSTEKYTMVDEAMKIVERMEKVGMVHNATNVRGIVSLLCNCCNDHCIVMTRWYSDGKPKDPLQFPSRYLPIVIMNYVLDVALVLKDVFLMR